MSGKVLVPVLVFGVVLLAVPIPAKADLPQWSTGDFWQYEGRFLNATDPHDRTERIEVVSMGDRVDGALRTDVPQAIELQRTDTADRAGSVNSVTSRYWLRASNHGLAKVSLFLSGGNVSRVDEIYSPPFDIYRFPLDVGDGFNATTTSQILNDGLSVGFRTSAFEVNVTGEQGVTVRVGGASRTFSCVIVRLKDPFGLGYSLLYYNEDVGQWVRQEHFARPNASVPEEKDLELSLTAYRYGPSILPIVAIGVIAVLALVTVALVWRGRRSTTPADENPLEEPPKKA